MVSRGRNFFKLGTTATARSVAVATLDAAEEVPLRGCNLIAVVVVAVTVGVARGFFFPVVRGRVGASA